MVSPREGGTLGARLEPCAHVRPLQDRLQVVSAGQLDADATGGRQHGGLHLRRHAAGADTRACTGNEDAHEIVDTCDALDQLRARVVRGRRVQSVDVREEHQGVSRDHLGDQGGQAVVIAEAQLPGGHSVVLVEDRDDAEAEEAREGRAHVRVVVAAHDVVRCQQDLRGVQVVSLERGRPTSHEQPLAHRGSCLNAGQILRLG